MDWINFAQDRDTCLAVVNTVTNLSVPRNAGELVEQVSRLQFLKDSAPCTCLPWCAVCAACW